MNQIKFKLLIAGGIVGYEVHRFSSYYNLPQIRIFHSKTDPGDTAVGLSDIIESQDKFIRHDEKELISPVTMESDGKSIKIKWIL